MSECVCECSVICVMCLSGLRGVCGVSKCCGGVIECKYCIVLLITNISQQ